MKNLKKQIVKFLAFLGVSAFLFWLVYRDQDWDAMLSLLREDVNYVWIWLPVIAGTLSHAVRALRWQMLTETMGKHISFANSFMGIMIGYFANLAIPRMGEFTRCGVVSKYENFSFSRLLGTVVTERVIDLLILLTLVGVVIVTQFKQMLLFFERNQGVEEKISSLMHSWWMLGVVAIFCILLWIVWRMLQSSKLKQRIKTFWEGLKEGFLTVKHVKNKKLFIFYSLFIWLMFYLMFYMTFFAFDFTSHLGPLVGLTVFVLGSFGMVAPVQGGIGAWHFMVIAGLAIYLPDTPNIEMLSKTFALLTHGLMTFYYIVMGIICLLIIPIYNSRRKTKPV
ncbi:MAG: flippase-like domain-containing protein [Culturomica sp.]|jgi:uncharacterized protein (TIRG00374 family)|nr:flippase-like domain-containing protein [Culturomica sp.]